EDTYKILSADWVKVSNRSITDSDGNNFSVAASRAADCTSSTNSPNYANAIWNPAHNNNFNSRGGTSIKFVTIHTVQGSYASAISWFRNPAAGVSTHYVIRASDGQVTQMVCEKDRAFHVKTDNASAIGIEHEGFIDDGGAWYTNEMYESSAALVRDICARNGINPLKTFGGPPTNGVRTLSNTCYHIKGHQHFRNNNHIDPGPFWDWDRYYRLINPEPTPIVFTDRKGDVFDSGKATGNYGDQERSVYLIKPEGATSIELTFKAFDLEGTREEPFDYLDIYDGENVNGQYLGRFTGDKLPNSIRTKSGAVFMEFRSDCQINRKGWHIEYNSRNKNPDCPAPTNLVVSNLFPMGATLSWDKVDGADMYLLYLSRDLEDKWALYKTSSNAVTATGLSANGLYQWQVQVVCGRDTSALIGESFVTPSMDRTGRTQIYTVRLNQGRFYDSGGTFSGYGNGENYVYRIIPPNGGKVVLDFSSFETERLDTLTIYDGKSATSPKIGDFFGDNMPSRITSTGNGITLFFRSDNATNGKGWTASWRSIEGGVVDNNNDGNDDGNNNNGGNTNNDGSVPDNSNFEPEIKYHASTPETAPVLENGYKKSFNLKFNDKDRSGRGIISQFYNIAQETPGGFRSNTNLGLFYDDFNKGFHGDWKSAAGNWKVVNGTLNQTNISTSNSNLYTNLTQSGNDTYLYHWKAKMTGLSDNKRHGIHFFCSKPENENRGDSYFVWIRDSDDEDYIEIYKTDNDKFDRKTRKEVKLEVNKVYDYKVIYNPEKGRIEVYVNNDFVTFWVDRFPLKKGKGISLRSGDCVVSYDDIIVYKKRDEVVKVSMGNKNSDDLKPEGEFIVNSLVVDQNIRWSRVGRGTSVAGVESDSDSNGTNSGQTGGNNGSTTGDNGTSNNSGIQTFTGDFDLSVNTPSGGKGFYLPAGFDGDTWRSNANLGFFLDEFPGNNPHRDWRLIEGRWAVQNGLLAQTDLTESNSNIFTPLTQFANVPYLYHWRTRITSSGDNRRFGLHFFASNGTQSNRGDSYFVWFRNYDSKNDKVEIYRVDNNEFALRESGVISIKPGEWIDCKVLYNPGDGQIEVWVNNSRAISWKDDKTPLQSGSAISFRTGDCQAEFDDLRVYQLAQSQNVKITVGSSLGKMVRFKSQNNEPTARVYKQIIESNGRWAAPETVEAIIK
ncbi:MAG: N-acetylmuramoyl-L-alanine amidase, partial [Bacteroidetes bacterium]|nr:N-acetylmuramoyl-L-alanine amidase [Bacteroidota bacterium]